MLFKCQIPRWTICRPVRKGCITRWKWGFAMRMFNEDLPDMKTCLIWRVPDMKSASIGNITGSAGLFTFIIYYNHECIISGISANEIGTHRKYSLVKKQDGRGVRYLKIINITSYLKNRVTSVPGICFAKSDMWLTLTASSPSLMITFTLWPATQYL